MGYAAWYSHRNCCYRYCNRRFTCRTLCGRITEGYANANGCRCHHCRYTNSYPTSADQYAAVPNGNTNAYTNSHAYGNAHIHTYTYSNIHQHAHSNSHFYSYGNTHSYKNTYIA